MTTMHKGTLLPAASGDPAPAVWGDITGTPTTLAGYGITGSLAEFNAALTGADFATGGGTATGTNTGDQTSVSGNAGTATALATGRTIAMTGDVTWITAAFDGTANVTAAGTIAAAAVTLAKMANLAQDQFIGRTTASTGVPETATITSAARTVLAGATVAAMRTTMGMQYTVGTGGMLKSFCDSTTTQAGTSGTAFWVYVGFLPAGTVIKHVGVAVNTGGTGAQTAEVCVATGTGPPAFANQTLTKVWADGTLGDLTVNASYVRNTTPNATALAADAHVWVGFRQAMASTQANLHAIQKDFGAGNFMSTAASGALTGAGPWTGTPIVFGGAHADIRGYC